MPEKSTAEKLMIKPGRRVRFVNAPDDLPNLLGAVPEGAQILVDPYRSGQCTPADVAVLFAKNRTELVALLPGLRASVAEGGIVWVAFYKGSSAHATDIHRDNINTYAHTLNMQAVAIIAINEDWSALRLKINEGTGG